MNDISTFLSLPSETSPNYYSELILFSVFKLLLFWFSFYITVDKPFKFWAEAYRDNVWDVRRGVDEPYLKEGFG